jgi:hypothetical protein
MRHDDLDAFASFLADPECVKYLIVPIDLGWSIRKEHWVHPQNVASIGVAKKLGATHERDTEIRGGPVGVWVSLRA